MPFMRAFHKINSFAHCSMHHYPNGFAISGHRFCFFHGGHYIIHIVTIHFKGNPTKSIKFFTNITQTHYFISRPVYLLAIPVNGSYKIIYFMMSSKHHRFPNLPFIHFSITMKRENQVFFTV